MIVVSGPTWEVPLPDCYAIRSGEGPGNVAMSPYKGKVRGLVATPPACRLFLFDLEVNRFAYQGRRCGSVSVSAGHFYFANRARPHAKEGELWAGRDALGIRTQNRNTALRTGGVGPVSRKQRNGTGTEPVKVTGCSESRQNRKATRPRPGSKPASGSFVSTEQERKQ